MADKKYVSNINVTDRYRNLILAGTPFVKEILVLHTFESLQRQTHITEYSATSPVKAVKGPKGKMLASIPGTTPDAAIHPPTLSQEQREKNARETAIAVAEGKVRTAVKNASKETEKVEKAEVVLAEEVTAKTVLDAAAKAEKTEEEAPVEVAPEKESTVVKIWNCNPEKIKEFKFEHLLSQYRTQCKKYKIEPKQFTDKDLLIKQLSSEYVAK